MCSCEVVFVENRAAYGEEVLISWRRPIPKCGLKNIFNSVVVQPSVTSPAYFGVGRHRITYTHLSSWGSLLKCFVEIVVKVKGISKSKG